MAGKWQDVGASRPPIRRELAEHGLDCIEEQGFAALTFPHLAERARVDEAQVRTYFHTLYDVAFAEARGRLEWLGATMADRAPGEELATALQRAANEYLDAFVSERDYNLRRFRLIEGEPQLTSWRQQLEAIAVQRILEASVGRSDDPVARVRAEMSITSGIAGLRAALREWAFSDGATCPISLFHATQSRPTRLVSVQTGDPHTTIDLRPAERIRAVDKVHS